MSGLAPSYIIAARRTALGRIGGLHKSRRLESLAAPVVIAALQDAKVAPERVDEIIIGNAMHGGNPARLIALASGLPEKVSAVSIDRQCASGLDAILNAIRSIGIGDSQIVVAGGAESVSTAPWRIAKPRSLYQTPHFMAVEPVTSDTTEQTDDPQVFEASEQLSKRYDIDRGRQDEWALRTHMKASEAQNKQRFVGEIVPLRANANEARDQGTLSEPTIDELESLSPYIPPTGTLTPGNTSAMHDGAAIVVVVSQSVWEDLGRPPAMRLVASASLGVAPHKEADAPVEVMKKLYQRAQGFNPKDIGLVELGETSAAQAIAFASNLGIDDDILNPDGGEVVRGHPFAASGAVLVVRLFTRMVRNQEDNDRPQYAIATLGAIGGIGVAALFERV